MAGRATSQPSRLGHLAAVGLAAVALTVAAVGCGSSSKKAETASTPDVSMVDFGFKPKQTTVKVGQTVTWTNDGQVDHTVKGKGFFTKKALGHGQKFSHRFTNTGRFTYLCTLHPSLMAGTIVVSG